MALTGTIGEDLKGGHDYMLEDTTAVANDTTTGDAQLVGGAQGELEIVVMVGDTDIVITDTKAFSVSLTESATEGGSFTALTTLYSVTASGETTLTAGTELGSFIIRPSDLLWAKAVTVNNDTGIVGNLTVYIRRVAR